MSLFRLYSPRVLNGVLVVAVNNIATVCILARQRALGRLLVNGVVVMLRFIGILDKEARLVHVGDWPVIVVVGVNVRRRWLGRGLGRGL